ncbi:outer membrane beta-barrel protein [Chitinophagaceae bacterium 26-R-25]|nr:outer membrane beta-barrel protein [Chitinophagaceae bacterium 26-R-25]
MYNLLRQKEIRLKILPLGIFLLLFSITAQCQLRDRLNLPDNDDKRYTIGIILMGTQNRFQISQHPQFLATDSVLTSNPITSMGLGIGGMHTLRLSKRFEVRAVFPQLLFVNKTLSYTLKYPESGESTTTTKTVESILLGFPVQLKLKSDRIDNFRVYMFAGAKWEYDLSSKAQEKNAEQFVKLKSSDFGIEAGLGFNFYMRYFILSPELKISNGISNVHSRDPDLKFSNVIDKIQSRQIIFSLIFEG